MVLREVRCWLLAARCLPSYLAPTQRAPARAHAQSHFSAAGVAQLSEPDLMNRDPGRAMGVEE